MMTSRTLAGRPTGDAVAARAASAFCDLGDLVMTLRVWSERGVRALLLDLQFDSGAKGAGEALRLLDAVCQMTQAVKGERLARGLRRRRLLGRPVNNKPAYGYKIIGRKGDRRFAPEPSVRRVGKGIVEWREQGHTWAAIYFVLLRGGCRRRDGREWSIEAIKWACKGEQQLAELEAKRRVAARPPNSAMSQS
jgi:hypothetical protein